MNGIQYNPFFVKTPEIMSAAEAVDLFVPMPDYNSIQEPYHTFIHGHRGCGKSMMFRFMSPDCQALYLERAIKDLPYYGVYLSIKNTDLNIGELNRLKNQIAGHVLSEHFLVVYLMVKALESVRKILPLLEEQGGYLDELREFCKGYIFKRLEIAGWQNDVNLSGADSGEKVLKKVIEAFDEIHVRSIQQVKRLFGKKDLESFDGVLLGFQDLLLPVMREMRNLSFMPSGPVYLLIDDADNLSYQQTQVLNTWVSYRTTADLVLKISTQLNYKTYSTVNAQRIESTHDYTEISVSNVYTGSAKENYPDWVERIVRKRLHLAKIDVEPRDFFPPDVKQEQAISELAKKIKEEWSPIGRGGYRPGDDAYRYARPEYIKSIYDSSESAAGAVEGAAEGAGENARAEYIRKLGGTSKHSHTYYYAGFDQLVHISSGIIRYFLDPAGKMFAEAHRAGSSKEITHIPPRIQDQVLRAEADTLMHLEFDKLIEGPEGEDSPPSPERAQKLTKLRNLILVLGATFYQYLVSSERSERRYFSFTISSAPDPEVLEVVKLGIQYGFFYETFVGTKDGRGRTPLYVLTRRLAPYFKLDPIGFSGYKSLTNAFLRRAIESPTAVKNRLRHETDTDKIVEAEQPSLF